MIAALIVVVGLFCGFVWHFLFCLGVEINAGHLRELYARVRRLLRILLR